MHCRIGLGAGVLLATTGIDGDCLPIVSACNACDVLRRVTLATANDRS